MSGALKLIVTVILICAGAFGLYWVISNADFFSGLTQRADDVQARTEELEREILAELRKLEKIQLSGEIFVHPVLLSLTDLSRPLPTPRLSRPNPFAPLN